MLFAVQTKQTSLPRVDRLWQSVPFMFTRAALNYKAAWPFYHQIKKNLLSPGWMSWHQAKRYPVSRHQTVSLSCQSVFCFLPVQRERTPLNPVPIQTHGCSLCLIPAWLYTQAPWQEPEQRGVSSFAWKIQVTLEGIGTMDQSQYDPSWKGRYCLLFAEGRFA